MADENESVSSDDSSVEDFKGLEDGVENAPFKVDAHMELIDAYRTNGELEKLMDARKRAELITHLPERAWVEWIEDEVKCLEDDEDHAIITNLYRRAIKAYCGASYTLWNGFLTFIKDKAPRKEVQQAFEEALIDLGFDPVWGPLVYQKYREFELSSIEDGDRQQRELKVLQLYLRQLSVPQPNVEEEILKELKERVKETDIIAEAEKRAGESRKLWAQRETFENSVHKGGLAAIEASAKLVEIERRAGDSGRIACSLLRAAHTVTGDSKRWLEYGRYLCELKKTEKALDALQRGVKEPFIREIKKLLHKNCGKKSY